MTRVWWVIFKKTQGAPWPGEWWEQFSTKKDAKKALRDRYETDAFHLVRVVAESEET